jgi:hypothetical protein
MTACFSPEEGNTLHHLVSKMLFLKKPVFKNPSVRSKSKTGFIKRSGTGSARKVIIRIQFMEPPYIFSGGTVQQYEDPLLHGEDVGSKGSQH